MLAPAAEVDAIVSTYIVSTVLLYTGRTTGTIHCSCWPIRNRGKALELKSSLSHPREITDYSNITNPKRPSNYRVLHRLLHENEGRRVSSTK